MASKVKKSAPSSKPALRQRRRGYTRVSSKNQTTIPVEALHEAGVSPGDELKVTADGQGRIVLEVERDPLEDFIGCLDDTVFPPGYLEELRSEWER